MTALRPWAHDSLGQHLSQTMPFANYRTYRGRYAQLIEVREAVRQRARATSTSSSDLPHDGDPRSTHAARCHVPFVENSGAGDAICCTALASLPEADGVHTATAQEQEGCR